MPDVAWDFPNPSCLVASDGVWPCMCVRVVVGSPGGCVAPETMSTASTETSWRTLTPAAGAS